MNQKFRKQEHLKSRKTITALFKEGKAVKAYPLIGMYLEGQEHEGVQVGFSVAKRKIRGAVQRNLIKRRMREAYRIHRDSYGFNDLSGLALMLIYVGNEPADFKTIEEKVCRILRKQGQPNTVRDKQSRGN